MSIFKKKSKVSPQLFTVTFYIAILGFLFGAFGLGFGLLNNSEMKSRDNSLATQNFTNYVDGNNLKFCYDYDIKPCTKEAIRLYTESHPNIKPVDY